MSRTFLIVIVDTNTARGENLIGSLHNRDKGWKKPRKGTQETYMMIMITKIIINTETEKSSPLPLSSSSLFYRSIPYLWERSFG